MSVQFGKWNFDERPIDPKDIDDVRPVLAPYGPDREGFICKNAVAILFRAFYTTPESEREQQPFTSNSGSVILWDGRLDNREELIHQLNGEGSVADTDLNIACAAYDKWGTKAFAKLIGDWAISIWNPTERSLVLARDFVGTRPLFYSKWRDQVTWSTILDSIVLLARRPLKLEKEYVAGWLGSFPASHLTPFVGIHAVPPSSFVRVTRDQSVTVKYWDFDPGKATRYAHDEEYEEHFRFAFGESVRRRLRSNAPVLAELSGGMDSSSIVCMADRIITRAPGAQQSLDTLSYYDDSEPNWNERPFFTCVERQRNRVGLHIDVGGQSIFKISDEPSAFSSTPASDLLPAECKNKISEYQCLRGHRVLLSGTGGDETLGGVPTPLPELCDLLARGALPRLAQQLKAWALQQRKPWLWLFAESVSEFLPHHLKRTPKHKRIPAWIEKVLVSQYHSALLGYEIRLKLFGALPSFQENLRTLDGLRRQIGCVSLRKDPTLEIRYPYLDRSLLEFVYSLPRNQLLRPGQRRSLMRRAMAGIVPKEVLARRRKAFVSRAPLVMIGEAWENVNECRKKLVSHSCGIVDAELFAIAVQSAHEGQELAITPMLRLLLLEHWLQDISSRGILDNRKDSVTLSNKSRPILISAEKS